MYPLESAYAGWLIFPWERSEEVLNAWSAWTRTVPDEVTSVGRILQLPDMEPIPPQFRGAKIVVVEAAFAGSEADGVALMAPLRALGPIADTFAQVPPQGLVRLHQDPEGRTPGHGEHTLLDSLTPETVARVRRHRRPRLERDGPVGRDPPPRRGARAAAAGERRAVAHRRELRDVRGRHPVHARRWWPSSRRTSRGSSRPSGRGAAAAAT